jgi:hypothetical protein
VIVFLIPVKHPQNSFDYKRTWGLLNRTLRSICQQTVDDYRIIVSCNKALPLHPLIPEGKVTVLTIDATPIEEGHPSGDWHTPQFDEHIRDKGLKRKHCLDYASMTICPSHYFLMDADDYVAPDLVEQILLKDQEMCLLDHGICFSLSTRVYYEIDSFFLNCGSSVAFAADWIYSQPNQIELLGATKAVVARHPNPYRISTPYMAAYCQHGDNHGLNLWKYETFLVRGKTLTPELTERFAIEGNNDFPSLL